MPPPPKTCLSCGREMTWRKKWEKNWDAVKFCSDACRRHRHSDLDSQLESKILELLQQRARDKTICPSEVARAIRPEDWNELMEPTRRAARRLVAAGKVQITQNNRVVDPSAFRGPIRIRLA